MLNMGYFASLLPHSQEDNSYHSSSSSSTSSSSSSSGSTRRSTRKRKSVLQEEQRKPKRASLEPPPHTKTHSSDSLEEIIGQVESPIIRQEELPPMPVSPTTATTARLKVMSIDFLCNTDKKEPISERRTSDCPLLDLLVDAAMDAEYLSSNKPKTVVVVNPEIHRDATQRVLLQQQRQHDSSSSIDSKADSAVSLSPPSRPVKEEEDRCWRRAMDDGLFNQSDMDALSDFFDDVSDLSSVSSTELSNWTSDEEDEDIESEKSSRKKKTQEEDLTCIACGRLLRRQDISEQLGADVSVTNELATWTWTPSAIFTDWKPKRCPRCERHYTIFRQEWPNRKAKNNVKKSRKKKIKKKSIKKPSPLTESIQDELDDQSYIPPSPLSEISTTFDEEEIAAF
ncbi:uncharacterized protein B0P05DRAFT_236621 [Gilbertella persicaria]|uniref:uncharacterized protein n=1 Tax=Gilbertella persicaria TaxID=101096 RepID=UPI00221F41B1|nr:uncharacterized protein B0P05DRAFT_236621 [Gilbertella persicaria]KAI8063696.1 hypothetical protein B0P05DRAFT_236621 [Gilbertella persicaria]